MKEKISRELENLIYKISYNNKELDMKGIIKEYKNTPLLSTRCPITKLTEDVYIINGVYRVSGTMVGNLRRDMINLMARVADSLGWIGYPNAGNVSRCIDQARSNYEKHVEITRLRKLDTATNFISQPR